MGLFSFIGSLLGSGSARRASQQAQAAQLDYLNRALTAEQQQAAQSRSDLSPWRTMGGSALGQIGDLEGLNGQTAQQSAITAVQNNPYYQSLYRNGLEANLQNASATGGIRGGNEVRSLANFSSDTLAQAIQQQLSNLGNVSNMGLNAASGTVNSGDQLTQAIAQILGQQGQVTAGGILTRGGINAQNWNNVGSFLSNAAQMIPGLGAFAKIF